MQKFAIYAICALSLATGCGKPAKITVREADGAQTTATIPQGMSAAELIQLRGIADAALTIRAEHQAQTYQLHRAQLDAQHAADARRDYLFLAGLAITCLCLAACVIGCFGIHCVWKGRPK